MSERVAFHFDPLCPWCYQTSRWARRLAELGAITVDWRVFCLELTNRPDDGVETYRAAPGLRTAIAVREAVDSDAVGDFYAALGAAIHQRGEAPDDGEVLRGALDEAGLPRRLYVDAIADEKTWLQVEDEHRALVEATRSFGVPTIVLDDGDGPAIFGPVISHVPTDADAVQLWQHVAWLARYDNFSELKRDRTSQPDLASVRRR